MFKKLKRTILAFVSAFIAGAIANSCHNSGGGCVLNDEEEAIYPCEKHLKPIARLYEVNSGLS